MNTQRHGKGHVIGPILGALLVLSIGLATGHGTVAEEVTFASGGASLHGTLTLPAGEAPFPAVVLLSGSGPQDRDNAHPSLPGYRPFAEIAERFASEGIAVLRFDERGVGESSGIHALATSFDLADDAEAALEFLRGRLLVDESRVGMLGHSEGAWLAAIVAERNENAAFVIALAPHAVPGLELLPVQAEMGLRASGVPQSQIDAILADQRAEIDLIATRDWDALAERVYEQTTAMIEGMPEKQREAMGDPEVAAAAQVEQSMAALKGWLYTFVTGDPADAWSGVDVPVLAMFGEFDTQVSVAQNRPVLEAALERAGNADATIVVLPGANHLFQEAESAGEDYASLDPSVMPELLDVLARWMTEHLP